MTLPIQFIFNFYGYDLNEHKQEFKEVIKTTPNESKIKLNYEAKPYQRRNKSETKYNKGYYCNLNQANGRSFNGQSNKSYKNKK